MLESQQKQAWHTLTVEETEKALNTTEEGLSDAEAAKRLAAYGPNNLRQKKAKSVWRMIWEQLTDVMVLILIAAAIFSFIMSFFEDGEGLAECIVILVVVILNATVGVVQEKKAANALESLKNMTAPTARVLREGEESVVPASELVPGDIVYLEDGCIVPADIRIIQDSNMKVQEAALTGESVPVEKDAAADVPADAPIGDRVNMAYSSCSVTYGHGKGVVVATGTRTEVGKIASMIQSVPDMRTPMQVRLDKLGQTLAVVCLVTCVLILGIGLLYGRNLMDMFMTAVSLAVAAIPEGLPAVSTVVLALGVQRLARQNAIVRNLPSVETLGSTTVICSDKTGTLTQNRMTVTKLFVEGSLQDVGYDSPVAREMLRTSILANDAVLKNGDDGTKTIGDPTETALLDAGLKYSLDKNEILAGLPRVEEIPFDSERKLMTTVHAIPDGTFLVAVKGGLDELLGCCSHIDEGHGARPLEAEDLPGIHEANLKMASQALRVLAVASKTLKELPSEITPATLENGLTFLGMVGMIDPPREEARVAVAKCRAAGIKPVMITGDHKITAGAIASSLGIMSDGDKVLTGADVESMSDDQLQAMAADVSVFARVAPEHKVRIVKAFQQRGNVVAMTGDGVNDAPALKLADIGVAMGITGTDVAKEAAT